MSTYLLFCVILCALPGNLLAKNQASEEDDYVAFYDTGLRDEFDWQLLKSVDNYKNVILSPISIKIVLALLYEGAAGTTEQELKTVLNFNPNKTIVRHEFTNIIDTLQNFKKYGCDDLKQAESNELYTLKLGTRIFLDAAVKPQQAFQSKACDKYQTKVESTNFTDTTKASENINGWVDRLTLGRINKLVSPDDVNNAVMFIANAIYFKGFWRHQFPKNQSYKGGFYLSPKNVAQVDYMFVTDDYFFIDSKELDAKMIRIPYKGRKFSMVIMLPNAKAGLADLIKRLTVTSLKNNMNIMDKVTVDLIIPRFKFDFQIRMTNILKNLGLVSMFQNTASLPGITRASGVKLQVSDVVQKSGIEVNEEGSVAFASTVVQIGNKFGDSLVVFNASQPFLFFIEDQSTHTILFVGKVEDPLETEPLPLINRFGENSLVPNANENIPEALTLAPSPTLELNPVSWNVPVPEMTVAKRFNYFDLELLREVSSSENVFISPASIKATLGMILEGARGSSAEEISKTLRLPLNQNESRNQLKSLLYDVSDKSSNSILESSNGIFISNKLRVFKNYQTSIQNFYKGFVRTLDFSNTPVAAKEINQWIYESTRGLIPSIVGPENLSPESTIVVTNALYFKGEWKKAFDESATLIKCFHLATGECHSVFMMQNSEFYNYKLVEDIDAHAVEIPYTDEKYAMLILLPRVKNNIQALTRDLQHVSFDSIVDKLEKTEVSLEIPRFQIDYTTDIIRPLQQLGIREIFVEKANLSGIAENQRIYIDNMLHKTKIDVNEKGTIAAAATGAVVIPLMGSSVPRVIADHPFAFFIYRKDNRNILFEGIVNKPTSAKPSLFNRANFYNPSRPIPQPQFTQFHVPRGTTG